MTSVYVGLVDAGYAFEHCFSYWSKKEWNMSDGQDKVPAGAFDRIEGDGRRPPSATGPAGVSTTEDITGRSPHRAPQLRELVLDNDTYGKLEQAVEDLDGTAVRRVPGGGLDLSGMVVRAQRDKAVPMPGGYGQGMRGGEL